MLYINEFEERLGKAFLSILKNKAYAERGNKRYRIFFYAYMFGSVCEDDLYFIGLNNFSDYHLCEIWDEKNKNRAILRYFTQGNRKSLRKDGDAYYLTDVGKDELFAHLIQHGFFTEDEREKFAGYKRRRVENIGHGHVVGASSLILDKCGTYNLLVEPNISSSGYVNVVGEKFFCRPDSILFNNDIEIYIEADRSSENNGQLSEKILRYESYIWPSEYPETSKTKMLLFVVQSKDMEGQEKVFAEIGCGLKKLNDYFEFYNRLFDDRKISYSDFIKRVKRETPDMIEILPDTIWKYLDTARETATMESTWELMNHLLERCTWNNTFVNRKRKIENLIARLPQTIRALENGNVLLIAPLLTVGNVCVRVLYDEARIECVKKWIFEKSDSIEMITYHERRMFCDDVTGWKYVLRNAFELVMNDGKIMFVCVENAGDDIGAYYRIKKLCKRKNYLRDLYIIYKINRSDYIDEICEIKNKFIENEDSAKLIIFDSENGKIEFER